MIENLPQEAPKRSWFMIASIVTFVAVSVFSIYFQVTVTSAKKEVKKLEMQKDELDKPLTGSAASKLNELQAAVAIKSQLQKIEISQVRWSKLMEKVSATIPKIKGTQDPIVIFRSYNGDTTGTITVNASTRGGSIDPFADASLLIKAFTSDPSFSDVFVPTLTKSIGSDGNPVLNFVLSFTYQQPNF